MQVTKTNAMRMLDAKKIGYKVFAYDNEDGLIHGTAVAEKIGKAAETVLKRWSLIAVRIFMYLLSRLPKSWIQKGGQSRRREKIEMLPVKDLQKWTGYIRGGCSPVGMKKLYPTFIDSSAEGLDTMAVSAGKIGQQMDVAPQLLAEVVHAKFTELIK